MGCAGAADLKLHSILESDRAWSAYALADLFPPWSEQAEWIAGQRSAVLIYRGLDPPLLFAHGHPAELDELFRRVPAGDYWFTLRPTDYARLGPRLAARQRVRMWRMWLPAAPARSPLSRRNGGGAAGRVRLKLAPRGRGLQVGAAAVRRLGEPDLLAIEQLFAALPDGPDAFRPAQLEHGVYFGIRGSQGLLSVAGTHVASDRSGVAALGNVATHPEHRGRGLARAVSQAVVDELQRQQIDTIVLNVRMDNQPALRLYRGLGFMPYCGFYEGRGSLHPGP